jgi:hypothetical protein
LADRHLILDEYKSLERTLISYAGHQTPRSSALTFLCVSFSFVRFHLVALLFLSIHGISTLLESQFSALIPPLHYVLYTAAPGFLLVFLLCLPGRHFWAFFSGLRYRKLDLPLLSRLSFFCRLSLRGNFRMRLLARHATGKDDVERGTTKLSRASLIKTEPQL